MDLSAIKKKKARNAQREMERFRGAVERVDPRVDLPDGALVLGGIAAFPSYFAILYRSRTRLDDSLDVFAGHGIGGMTGALLTGVFAQKAWNAAGSDGLLAGNGTFFVRQCVAAIGSSVWAFSFTLGMLWLIDRVTPVRVSDEVEESGLDFGLHHEEAYVGLG